ncbi:MAG: HAMP domain-containing histidine kinase [Proteobacteria bacterium]|nr:HAMP domain-containing histidine kinase [Pseudomonadota bacterium]
MLRLLSVTSWPLALKVPLLVAALMVAIAVTISQVVLSRLVKDQESNLALLTGAYLDGLSAAVLPAVIRGDVWEAFDSLDRARGQYAGVEARYAIVELPNGAVLAASDPVRFPTQSAVPDELRKRFGADDGLVIDDASGLAWLARTLRTKGFAVGRLLAEIDIVDLLRVRHQVLATLILVNGGLTLAFAIGGYLMLKRMLQPLGVLARYVESIREGRIESIPERHRRRFKSEFGQLFDRFNAMARAVSERETLASHLAEQEKYAMLGRLASGMAHEVNNPLGGMLNAIDTIQAHGDDPEVLRKSLEFLKRGLAGIRNVARATLVTYKGGADAALLTPGDLDDLPFLVQHETGVRQLRLEWRNRIEEPLAIDGPAVRQITLNLLLNACGASPAGGCVTVDALSSGGALRIVVSDEGPGLPSDMAALLDQADEVPPPRASKGLGLWTTGHLVRRLKGSVAVERPTGGTRVLVTLPVVVGKETLHAA